jgi:fido (protein-threonine AMPylation protein)
VGLVGGVCRLVFPPPDQVHHLLQSLMTWTCEWLSSQELIEMDLADKEAFSFSFIHQLVVIHPAFRDGNKRTGRELCKKLLQQLKLETIGWSLKK